MRFLINYFIFFNNFFYIFFLRNCITLRIFYICLLIINNKLKTKLKNYIKTLKFIFFLNEQINFLINNLWVNVQ